MSTTPLQLLKEINDRYSDCWKIVDKLRNSRGAELDWPEYCFLPLAGSYAIVSGGQRLTDLNKGWDISRLGALAAWRVTQGIYRFDKDLYSELIRMEVGPLPPQVLHRMPEWCVYIELQEEYASYAKGVFAHIEYDVNDGREELRLLFDTTGNIDGLMPVPIHLTGSLADGLAKAMVEADKQAAIASIALMTPDTRLAAKELGGVVSLILYLCSVNADLSGQPTKPTPVRTKRGSRIFPPSKQTYWDVGYRIGPMLKQAAKERSAEGDDPGGRPVRPHVRRAHWHHYWTGPRESQELTLKWLSPILVNVDNVEELPMTVRPVQ